MPANWISAQNKSYSAQNIGTTPSLQVKCQVEKSWEQVGKIWKVIEKRTLQSW